VGSVRLKDLARHKTAIFLTALPFALPLGRALNSSVLLEIARFSRIHIGSAVFLHPKMPDRVRGKCKFRSGGDHQFENSAEWFDRLSLATSFENIYRHLYFGKTPTMDDFLHQQFCDGRGTFARLVGCGDDVLEVEYQVDQPRYDITERWTVKCER
jgi:hypothetical protein